MAEANHPAVAGGQLKLSCKGTADGLYPGLDAADGTTWDLNQTRTHNALNEITDLDGGDWIDPAHDAAGNMTRAPRPGQESTAAETLLNVYDAWNRLVKVFKDSNTNGTLDTETDTPVAEYRYDGLNRRIAKAVRKVVSGNERWDRTDYYYNESWQCLEERFAATQESKDTVATTPNVQWLWDIRYIDAPVLRWRDDNDDGDFADAGETLHYCNDANMNVTALVNTSGTVLERVTYDPYGKPKFYDADWSNPSDTSAYANEILYCGYRFDPETGLYSVRHRCYHPTLGRWLSRDPPAIGTNPYEYVENEPVLHTDPFGLIKQSRYWGRIPDHEHTASCDSVGTNGLGQGDS